MGMVTKYFPNTYEQEQIQDDGQFQDGRHFPAKTVLSPVNINVR